MINNKHIKKALKKNPNGLTITALVDETKLKRCQVRVCIAYMLGSKEIQEMQVGMAKLYKLNDINSTLNAPKK